MHQERIHLWEHDHTFGTDVHTSAEWRTRWVVALTLVMMVAEIAAGTAFGSMALLADGWHMGTHAAALGIAVYAYAYARRHANDPSFSFGTGKVSALGGFASAIGLAVVALLVLVESVSRLLAPVAIRFDEAIVVAVLGLMVNLASAALLRERPHHHEGESVHHHRDHNLRGAYLHVLADAMTSVLAIGALTSGKLLGWNWMDPAIGIVGSLIIARWSVGLLRDTSRVLLDAEVESERRAEVRDAIESHADDRIADLHLWRVGPRHLAAIVSVVTSEPRDPGHYRERLAGFSDLVHVTVEVHCCAEGRSSG